MVTAHRPETAPDIDPATERAVRERLARANEDAQTAVDARQALAAIRKKLEYLKPR